MHTASFENVCVVWEGRKNEFITIVSDMETAPFRITKSSPAKKYEAVVENRKKTIEWNVKLVRWYGILLFDTNRIRPAGLETGTIKNSQKQSARNPITKTANFYIMPISFLENQQLRIRTFISPLTGVRFTNINNSHLSFFHFDHSWNFKSYQFGLDWGFIEGVFTSRNSQLGILNIILKLLLNISSFNYKINSSRTGNFRLRAISICDLINN